jgi:hypothetical protein
MLANLLNVVLFQIGWFASVLGAAHGHPWLGPFVAVPIIGAHLWQAPDRVMAFRRVLFVGCLGTVIDSALGFLGLLQFQETVTPVWFCPPWLIALWTIFATTLRSSLAWLADRLRLAALLGGIFGPISYYAGQELGAFRLDGSLLLALLVFAPVWAALLPLLLWWSGRRDN